MEQKKLLKYLVVLMFLMFFANQVITALHFYYTVWWVDMVMHFFGGFWVSLFFIYVFNYILPMQKQLLAIVLGVLVIGVLYEFFEFYLNIISTEPFSMPDTLSDMFFDLLGGAMAMYYSLKRIIPAGALAV